MGLFDFVTFTCPKCGKQAEDQTKVGPCIMSVYELDKEMPIKDAVAINGVTIECNHCSNTFVIESPLPIDKIMVKIRGENYES